MFLKADCPTIKLTKEQVSHESNVLQCAEFSTLCAKSFIMVPLEHAKAIVDEVMRITQL
jgi:hypothetical protein